MNLSDHEIESALRLAPQPGPPTALKEQLITQVRLQPARSSSQPVKTPILGGWLRRWWPALAPASISLACAAVIVATEMEARDLRQGNVRLAEQCAALQAAAATAAVPSSRQGESASEFAAAEQKEIARLKERAAELAAEVARLGKIQAENESLRKQPVAAGGPNTEDLDALAKAREKAMSINCINNLKQIGLAARLWAMDNKDVDPRDFLSMSNELNSPKILACPADTSRQAAPTFAAFTDANCSYELLAPAGSEREPDRVLTRCPIHGHVGLCDGSVHSEVARKHSDWLIQRDQKLYLKTNP